MRAEKPVSQRIAVGVDIVKVDRVARLIDENERAGETIFTQAELDYCRPKRRPYEHMAARFAAKEAVLKAFGSGVAERMHWTEVEVVRGAHGRPRIELHGSVAERARRRRLQDLAVSLSHTEDLAIAQVVAVWQDE